MMNCRGFRCGPQAPSSPPGLLVAASLVLVACGPVEPPESSAAAGARGAGPCIADEPRLLHYARWLATDPDPRLDSRRRRYGVEKVAASEVEHVQTPAVCQEAGIAYRDARQARDAPDAVAVIRVGDRYIVTSRVGGSTSLELASAVVLDESLRVVETSRR
ncbi:MAG: hypothetical protein ACODAB_04935 [Gemmatimonadota bacterium]